MRRSRNSTIGRHSPLRTLWSPWRRGREADRRGGGLAPPSSGCCRWRPLRRHSTGSRADVGRSPLRTDASSCRYSSSGNWRISLMTLVEAPFAHPRGCAWRANRKSRASTTPTVRGLEIGRSLQPRGTPAPGAPAPTPAQCQWLALRAACRRRLGCGRNGRAVTLQRS